MTSSSSNAKNATIKPKVIVFDLDYTLWPFWVDTHFTPPFRKENGHVLDAYGSKVKYYPEASEVLQELANDGYQIGIASRTSEIRGAESLLTLYDWNKFITYKQIFPGSKVTHFINIKKDSHLEYNEMLFFDDEHRNIKDIQRIGVISVLVKNGITKKLIEQGLAEFAAKNIY